MSLILLIVGGLLVGLTLGHGGWFWVPGLACWLVACWCAPATEKETTP